MAKRTCSVVLLGAVLLPCTAPFSFASDLEAIPTHEAVGLYAYAPSGKEDCPVRYRRAGDEAWKPALDLWYDARSRECRGSIVGLVPGQRYEAEVLVGDKAKRSVDFSTWPEARRVARTVKVAPGNKTLHIREGGKPDGYVVYEGSGATIDVQGREEFDVVVDASYVIVRGFALKGAARDAIRIEGRAHDVVIEDNDISGWGRKRDNGFGMDMDAAVRAICRSCPMVERVTVQRNRIHDPRYSANSWSDGHPEGPQAIAFSWCGGQHVFRHNEITGGEGKHYNDAIGGEENMSRTGFPNADSDIYGNLIRDAWDDGIESEGGNRNVRIWGNYIDNTATGVGATPTTVGPLYIFRNVYDRSRFRGKGSPDDDERQPFVKAGSPGGLGDGRRYIIHNTMLQTRDPRFKLPLGGAAGLGGTGSDQPINNTWTRNNIFESWKEGKGMWDVGRDNDFRGDVKGKKGVDQGVRVPNFNDDFKGRAPDAGAHEAGAPPMKFGIAASKGPAAGP